MLYFRTLKEADANKLKLTPQYLELKFIEAIANNSKMFFGNKVELVPFLLTPMVFGHSKTDETFSAGAKYDPGSKDTGKLSEGSGWKGELGILNPYGSCCDTAEPWKYATIIWL